MDKSREEFEAWASDNGASPRAIQRGTNGGYLLMTIASAWETWQASRKSLVVTLPRDVTNVTSKYYEEGRDDVIAAVEAAGITVKGEGGDLISTPQHVLDEKWKNHFGGEGDEQTNVLSD